MWAGSVQLSPRTLTWAPFCLGDFSPGLNTLSALLYYLRTNTASVTDTFINLSEADTQRKRWRGGSGLQDPRLFNGSTLIRFSGAISSSRFVLRANHCAAHWSDHWLKLCIYPHSLQRQIKAHSDFEWWNIKTELCISAHIYIWNYCFKKTYLTDEAPCFFFSFYFDCSP